MSVVNEKKDTTITVQGAGLNPRAPNGERTQGPLPIYHSGLFNRRSYRRDKHGCKQAQGQFKQLPHFLFLISYSCLKPGKRAVSFKFLTFLLRLELKSATRSGCAGP
jgi:hypothetical protein